MTSFIKKIKSLAFVITAFSFLVAVTISSCTPKDKASEEDTDSVEVVEAASSEEHPTDSLATATEGEEHPTDGEEHPTEGEEEEEHPTEEEK